MKRINRKKLIEELEELRQGFRSLSDLVCKTEVEKMTANSYHRFCDKMIVDLGGDSIYDQE